MKKFGVSVVQKKYNTLYIYLKFLMILYQRDESRSQSVLTADTGDYCTSTSKL